MAERLSNLGYSAFVKEMTPGTAATPTTFLPFYDTTLNTNFNFVDQTPIYGNKFATFATLQSTRDHKGDITVMAEPNTTAQLLDMLLNRTSTTGSAGLFTHAFDLTAVDSNSYTWDISSGNIVTRYFGFKASKIAPVWNKTELQWKVTGSALGSFQGRTLSGAPTGSGPYTVPFDTSYDPKPTMGLVVGDLIRFYKATSGVTIDATVASIVDGTHITTTTDVSTLVTGDAVYLRPATVAFTLLPTFIWPKTEFRFADSAANALTAAQLRVETGSSWDVSHDFESDSGAARSGGFDPAALVRKTGNATFTVKRFFDTPTDLQNANRLTNTAAAVRLFSGNANQYEARFIFNQMVTDGTIAPSIKSGEINYSELKYHLDFNQTDGKGYQVLVTNALATI